MSLFKSEFNCRQLIEKIALLFVTGSQLADEMYSANPKFRFAEWALRLRDLPHAPKDVATDDRLCWVWDALGTDPDLRLRFLDLPPADSAAVGREPIQVFNTREWFVVGLVGDSTAHLLAHPNKPAWNEPVAVRIDEPLFMRHGKADRLECCDCRCEVLIRVEDVHTIEAEAALMSIDAERITLEPNLIRVQVDSLNQAYTVASRRLEHNRRSHGGRIYHHLVHVAPTLHRTLLEHIRQSVEHGTWQVPSAPVG